MPEFDGAAVLARLAEMESYDPDYLYENKGLADDLRAALAEIDRLGEALALIADGDMPEAWHPGNLAWWLRGIARSAWGQAEWKTGVESRGMTTDTDSDG